MCLSLLGTWAGRSDEVWSASTSNVLQVRASAPAPLTLLITCVVYYVLAKLHTSLIAPLLLGVPEPTHEPTPEPTHEPTHEPTR